MSDRSEEPVDCGMFTVPHTTDAAMNSATLWKARVTSPPDGWCFNYETRQLEGPDGYRISYHVIESLPTFVGRRAPTSEDIGGMAELLADHRMNVTLLYYDTGVVP